MDNNDSHVEETHFYFFQEGHRNSTIPSSKVLEPDESVTDEGRALLDALLPFMSSSARIHTQRSEPGNCVVNVTDGGFFLSDSDGSVTEDRLTTTDNEKDTLMVDSDSHVEETQDVEPDREDFLKKRSTIFPVDINSIDLEKFWPWDKIGASHAEELEPQCFDVNPSTSNDKEHLESTISFFHRIPTQERDGGKWVVKVIDSDENVTEERLTANNIEEEEWAMKGCKIVLEFGPYDQPEGGSGGLFGTWLGNLCSGHPFGITYGDWRKVEKQKKDKVWNNIQHKFHFDASNEKYKKSVMKSLSQKAKYHRNELWKVNKCKTVENSLEHRPSYIPEDEWQDFVQLQFSEKTKKLRARNQKSRSYYKTPHTLGKKSIARKSKEFFTKTGKRLSCEEMFVSTRQNLIGEFVSQEARDISEKLTEKMTKNMANTSEINTTSSKRAEVMEKIFGADCSVHVPSVGPRPTPTFFEKHITSTSTETEVSLKNRIQVLENKLEKMNELEAKLKKMNELEAKLEKMNELEAKWEKMNEFIDDFVGHKIHMFLY